MNRAGKNCGCGLGILIWAVLYVVGFQTLKGGFRAELGCKRGLHSLPWRSFFWCSAVITAALGRMLYGYWGHTLGVWRLLTGGLKGLEVIAWVLWFLWAVGRYKMGSKGEAYTWLEMSSSDSIVMGVTSDNFSGRMGLKQESFPSGLWVFS